MRSSAGGRAAGLRGWRTIRPSGCGSRRGAGRTAVARIARSGSATGRRIGRGSGLPARSQIAHPTAAISAGASSMVGAAPSPAAPSRRGDRAGPDQPADGGAGGRGDVEEGAEEDGAADPRERDRDRGGAEERRDHAVDRDRSRARPTGDVAAADRHAEGAADELAGNAGPDPGKAGEGGALGDPLAAGGDGEEGRRGTDQSERRGERRKQPVADPVEDQGGRCKQQAGDDRQSRQAGERSEQRDGAEREEDRERSRRNPGWQRRHAECLGRRRDRAIGVERAAGGHQRIAEVAERRPVVGIGLKAGVDRRAEPGRELRPDLAEVLDGLADRPGGRGGAEPGDRVEAGPELVEGEPERVDVGGRAAPSPEACSGDM